MYSQLIIIFILGFLSGFPLPLYGNLLQAWFASNGASVLLMSSFGLLNAFALLRFVWGPLLDRFYFSRIGRRKTWILFTQTMIFVILILMSLLSPKLHTSMILILASILALMSSMTDVAIDAHRIEFVKPNHYGYAAVIAVYAYRLALLCSGGAALFLAHRYGFQSAYLLMASIVCLGVCLYLPSNEPQVKIEPQKIGFRQSYQDVFQKDWFFYLAGLIFCIKMGEVFVANSSPMIIPFLINGLGLNLNQIAYINNVFGLVAQLTGGALAAVLLSRYPAFKLILMLGGMELVSNLMFLTLSCHPQESVLLWASVIIENLSSGLCSTVLVALIMGVVNPQYTATQFSFWMMFVIVPRVIAGPLGGGIYHQFGWPFVFITSSSIMIVYLFFWSKLNKNQQFRDLTMKTHGDDVHA